MPEGTARTRPSFAERGPPDRGGSKHRRHTDPGMTRLLVVDDEPDFRFLAKAILEETDGMRVVGEAADGEAAIREAARLKPDAILLDLNMPGLGGLRALPRLRSASPASRVFVVSVAHDQRELHQAKMAGAHGFIDKALPNDRFVAAVKSCLAAAADGWSEHRRDSFGQHRRPASG